jgi:DNA replication protein DnaC
MNKPTHDEMMQMIADFQPSVRNTEHKVSAEQRNERSILGLVESIARNAAQSRENTVVKDGIYYCSICGSPVEAWVNGPANQSGERKKVLMPVRCDCDRAKERLYQEQKSRADYLRELRDLRRTIGMTETTVSFADDDFRFRKISDVCRKYVSEWEQMYKSHTGILFYGDKGLGKSFYAECIVNELAKKQVLTGFATTAELVMLFQNNYDKDEILDAISRFQLLALDDLGAERTTSFGAETIYSVVNRRYREGKPTIVTTNIELEELKRDNDLLRGRIYDRIIEMCPIAIPMSGDSRREGLAKDKRAAAKDIMRKQEGVM